jgi:hypothetical protein
MFFEDEASALVPGDAPGVELCLEPRDGAFVASRPVRLEAGGAILDAPPHQEVALAVVQKVERTVAEEAVEGVRAGSLVAREIPAGAVLKECMGRLACRLLNHGADSWDKRFSSWN